MIQTVVTFQKWAFVEIGIGNWIQRCVDCLYFLYDFHNSYVLCVCPTELRVGAEILPEGSRAGLGRRTASAGHNVLQWVCAHALWACVCRDLLFFLLVSVKQPCPFGFLGNSAIKKKLVAHQNSAPKSAVSTIIFSLATSPSPSLCWGSLTHFCLSIPPLPPQMGSGWSVTTSRPSSSSIWPRRRATSWPSTTWPRCMPRAPALCAPATPPWRWAS